MRIQLCIRHLQARGLVSSTDFNRELGRTVHAVIHPLVDAIDFLAVCLGVDINRCFVCRKQVIECGIEHADNFRAFIVDDRIELVVPQNRDREPSDHEVATSSE
jgi:hypothetical protein